MLKFELGRDTRNGGRRSCPSGLQEKVFSRPLSELQPPRFDSAQTQFHLLTKDIEKKMFKIASRVITSSTPRASSSLNPQRSCQCKQGTKQLFPLVEAAEDARLLKNGAQRLQRKLSKLDSPTTDNMRMARNACSREQYFWERKALKKLTEMSKES